MKKSLITLIFVSFLVAVAMVHVVQSNNMTPSACQAQCLPVLASHLQIQASLLQSLKSDLETTKQQLQQSTSRQWPSGHYCILASGSCPAGFSRSAGHMRALSQYAASATYITPATFEIVRSSAMGVAVSMDIGLVTFTSQHVASDGEITENLPYHRQPNIAVLHR